jgi:hypothetical protein
MATALHRRWISSLVIAVLVAAFALTGAQIALAVFITAKVGGPLTVATGSLGAAGSLTAAQVNCRTNKSPEIELEWTVTSSTYATSYAVERATASAGPYTSVATVALDKTSYTDSSGALASSTTYYYRVSVVFHSWSKPSAYVSVKTLSKFCV